MRKCSAPLSAANFFSAVSIGSVLGFLIGLLIIWARAESFREPVKERLRFEESLLLVAAGESDDTASHTAKIGSYLRSEVLKGEKLSSVIARRGPHRVIFLNLKETANWNAVTDYLLKTTNVPGPVVLMAGYYQFDQFAENPKNLELLEAVILGKEKVPVFDHNFSSWPLSSWIFAIVFGQLVGFLLLCGMASDNHKRWHDLPWGKPWPYLGLAALIPALFVPLFFKGVGWFFSIDFSEKIKKAKERKEAKRHLSTEAPSGQTHETHDGEELLQKLRSRLGEERR
mgnify:CR=1 FL=1